MRGEVCYCASCESFPLTKVDEAGRAKCQVRLDPYTWNDRACVLYNEVSPSERRARKPIVVALHEKTEQAKE